MANRLGLAIITTMLISGCTPQAAEWTPAQNPKKNRVERSYMEYSITYPIKQKSMPEFVKDDLEALAQNTLASTNSTRIVISEFGGHDKNRMDNVYKFFRKWGIPKDNIVVDKLPNNELHGSGIIVGIEKFSVVNPSCPNWEKSIGDSQGHEAMRNMGCAQAVNFGMMVADPRDLVTGKDADLYDGTRHALDVEMYRKDKVKALKYESTSSSQAQTQSSSGGGQ